MNELDFITYFNPSNANNVVSPIYGDGRIVSIDHVADIVRAEFQFSDGVIYYYPDGSSTTDNPRDRLLIGELSDYDWPQSLPTHAPPSGVEAFTGVSGSVLCLVGDDTYLEAYKANRILEVIHQSGDGEYLTTYKRKLTYYQNAWPVGDSNERS